MLVTSIFSFPQFFPPTIISTPPKQISFFVIHIILSTAEMFSINHFPNDKF